MKNRYFSSQFPQKKPFFASKSQNFEKVYKISPKTQTIVYLTSKDYACYSLFVGARLFKKECPQIAAQPGMYSAEYGE